MIIIGNKKLRETNKNFRALIIKLHKIIIRKDTEFKNILDDEYEQFEQDLKWWNKYTKEEMDLILDLVYDYKNMVKNRINKRKESDK